jgi:hypothetical protein
MGLNEDSQQIGSRWMNEEMARLGTMLTHQLKLKLKLICLMKSFSFLSSN